MSLYVLKFQLFSLSYSQPTPFLDSPFISISFIFQIFSEEKGFVFPGLPNLTKGCLTVSFSLRVYKIEKGLHSPFCIFRKIKIRVVLEICF